VTTALSDDDDDDELQQQQDGTTTSAVAVIATIRSVQTPLKFARSIAPRTGTALVSCGHSRFYANCADAVAANSCPICRLRIYTILRLYN